MSSAIKKYGADLIDTIKVRITATSHPQVFNEKLKELLNSGLTEIEAKDFINTSEFELELYYSPDLGMFAVESEAVESCELFDPYTGIKMLE